jgi:hypothetical protein
VTIFTVRKIDRTIRTVETVVRGMLAVPFAIVWFICNIRTIVYNATRLDSSNYPEAFPVPVAEWYPEALPVPMATFAPIQDTNTVLPITYTTTTDLPTVVAIIATNTMPEEATSKPATVSAPYGWDSVATPAPRSSEANVGARERYMASVRAKAKERKAHAPTTVAALRAACKARGLPVTGSKAILAARLSEAAAA